MKSMDMKGAVPMSVLNTSMQTTALVTDEYNQIGP